MALAPLSQTIILTEDGVPVPATKQVNIPPFVPSLTSVFEDGRYYANLAPRDVPGLVEAFEELNATYTAKGR